MRYFMTFSYDGSEFNGYQKQLEGRTVQGELEGVLKRIHGDKDVSVVASGRTDALVHAINQKAHFELDTSIECNKLLLEAVHSMLSHFEDDIKSISAYVGEVIRFPDVIDIKKTNIAASRDRNGNITGVLRFGLITDSIYINNIYADDKSTYLDLINLIKNLTNRKIEIGIYPIREDLLSVLSENGFKKSHSDYKYKF